jgi:hypothetical protein
MQFREKYRLSTIFWLSVLYYLALILISAGTMYLEYFGTKVVSTETIWVFFIPWPVDTVAVNPIFFALGLVIDIAACLLLWRWHAAVLANNLDDYTKGWKVGYVILLILSVVLCVAVEFVVNFLELFDAMVEHGTLLGIFSYFLIPVMMVALVIRNRRLFTTGTREYNMFAPPRV